MKAEQLRKSILQMAIQGKLVSQDSTDEPASVLLEKIRAEKENLIKQGKIKKDKNDSVIFKGKDGKFYEKIGKEIKDITEELPFEIPDSWVWGYLKDFVLMAFSGKSPQYSKTPTPHKVVGQQSNQWGGLDLRFIKYATEEFVVDMPPYYYLQDGDVLLNTLGNGTLGRSSYYQKNDIAETLLTDGHLFVFRTLDKILSLYLRIYLVNKYDEIVKSANGSTNQTFLSLGKTMQWLVPVPPFAEQKRIVEAIEKFEPLLAEYEKLEQQATKLDNEIFDKIKKSILQYAIQGKLVPQDSTDEPASVLLAKIKAEKESLIKQGKIKKEKPLAPITDDEKPFDIPDNWEWVRLGDICDYIHRGKSPKYGEEKKLPIIAQKCNQWDKIWVDRCLFSDVSSISKYKNENYVRSGDILVNSTGTGTVGRTGIVKDYIFEKYKSYVVDSHVTLIRTMPQIISNYIYMYLISPLIQISIEEKCSGSTNQIELAANTICNYVVPLPPLNEQKRIVAHIEEIFAQIDNVK